MATKNYSVVESDLSGSADAVTYHFGFDGVWYEIDLTDEEHTKMAKALKKYLDVARKSTYGRRAPRKLEIPDITPELRDKIREWAQDTGLDIADRGMIPKKIMTAYEEAHPEVTIEYKSA